MLRRLFGTSALPLTLALQGLSLTLLAFFLSPEPPRQESLSRIGTGDLPGPPRGAANLQIPRDLARERLPVPKFPDPDDGKPSPAPRRKADAPEAPIDEGRTLAALRVETVALASLAIVNVNAPAHLPGPPDTLEPHEISGGSGGNWLSGAGGGRRAADGNGFGARGPSDSGFGDGGWGSRRGPSGGDHRGRCPRPTGVGSAEGGSPEPPAVGTAGSGSGNGSRGGRGHGGDRGTARDAGRRN
jgi:hypothetical protein